MSNKDKDNEEYLPIKKKSKKQLNEKQFFEDGYDENFVGDENDRKYLDSLNELQYQQIINQRKEKREEQKKKLELLNKNNKQKALEELAQQKRQVGGYARMSRSSSEESDTYRKGSTNKDGRGGDMEDEEEPEQDDEDEEEEGEVDERRQKHSHLQDKEQSETDKQLKEKEIKSAIAKVTLKRNFLDQIVMRQGFNEMVKGCFVRVVEPFPLNKGPQHQQHQTDGSGIGSSGTTNNVNSTSTQVDNQKYLLCQIEDVHEGEKNYKIQNSSTNKELILKVDGEKTRNFRMIYVSNQDFTEGEWTNWVLQNEKWLEKNKPDVLKKKWRDFQIRLRRGGGQSDQTLQQIIQNVEKLLAASATVVNNGQANLRYNDIKTHLEVLKSQKSSLEHKVYQTIYHLSDVSTDPDKKIIRYKQEDFDSEKAKADIKNIDYLIEKLQKLNDLSDLNNQQVGKSYDSIQFLRPGGDKLHMKSQNAYKASKQNKIIDKSNNQKQEYIRQVMKENEQPYIDCEHNFFKSLESYASCEEMKQKYVECHNHRFIQIEEIVKQWPSDEYYTAIRDDKK